MKIVILNGSPNKKGSTNILINNFTAGALESNHKVEYFDLPHMNIHACGGCVACGYNGSCVQKDDVEKVKSALLSADMLVFATPLYYYGFSAQLKTMIDRFCAFNTRLQRKHLKSALIVVSWNDDDWTMDAITAHYKTLVNYLNMKDMGMILGKGCGTPNMTQNSKYPTLAYDFGKNLK